MSCTPIARQVLRRQISRTAQLQSEIRSAQVIGRRFYATEEKDERESFKGQLYQSTNERVQRERADQQRFAQHREAQRASRSSAGLYVPLGKVELVGTAVEI